MVRHWILGRRTLVIGAWKGAIKDLDLDLRIKDLPNSALPSSRDRAGRPPVMEMRAQNQLAAWIRKGIDARLPPNPFQITSGF
jgi:hypothetical protein